MNKFNLKLVQVNTVVLNQDWMTCSESMQYDLIYMEKNE